MSPSAALANFVLRRLEALMRAPDGWGPPHAVELQVLLLVEAWHVVQGAPQEEVDATTARFARFLGQRLPGPPVPLAWRLGLEQDHQANPRFLELLRAFVMEEMQLGRERALVHGADAPSSSSLCDRDDPRHLCAEA
jgi:hypothetical protein